MSSYYIGSDLNRIYYISHHGIKGQKWGIRRFQNEDGSLTAAGKLRNKSSSEMPSVRGYTYWQTKLGYNKRDEARDADGFRRRTGYDVAKAAQNLDQAKVAVKNAQRRKDRADSFFKDLSHTHYITSPDGKLTANAYYASEAYQRVVDAWKEEQRLADKELTEAEKQLRERQRDREAWTSIYTDRRIAAEQAAAVYSKTPLGRLESAKSAISKGVSFVKGLFKRKK